jgi:hypothetical protein
LFDTADVYGHGRSERLVGRLVGRLVAQVPRAELVLVSKVGYFTGTAAHGFAPGHMRRQLEQTLENLRTDRLDVYFLHHSQFGPSAHAPGVGWVDVGDLGGDRPAGEADPAGGQAPGPDAWGAGLVHVGVENVLLPFTEATRVGGVGEDVLGGPVDVGAGDDRRHQLSYGEECDVSGQVERQNGVAVHAVG